MQVQLNRDVEELVNSRLSQTSYQISNKDKRLHFHKSKAQRDGIACFHRTTRVYFAFSQVLLLLLSSSLLLLL